FLYMFILLASQLMARSAVEEKLNGMIELIISDISPMGLLSGKLLGVTASVLLLVFVWLFAGFAFMGNAVFFINQSIDISLPAGVLFYFIGAFAFGYILYTSFILLFVSSVTSEQEVNQAMSAGVAVILIPYFLSFFWVMENPNSTVSAVASLIPFFTPLIMPLRLSISNVPFWEIILSITLLAFSAWGMLLLAGKVYRISMLMVGKPLRLKEVLRLIRMK
ncbi:ABC transporter permease, partial [candidate division WOR-3 bacterium]|nr:ABC transporter permease [candidate division WOR-3 bacterium]